MSYPTSSFRICPRFEHTVELSREATRAKILACLLYLAAQLGQKLGAWQTFQLHQAYQAAIGRPTEIG